MLGMATGSFESRQYAGTTIASIQCAISSLDAPTAAKKGLRASGDHRAVLSLVRPLLAPGEPAEPRRQLNLLLGMKNSAQYESDPVSRDRAHGALRAACRMRDRVVSRIGRAHGTSPGGPQ